MNCFEWYFFKSNVEIVYRFIERVIYWILVILKFLYGGVGGGEVISFICEWNIMVYKIELKFGIFYLLVF